MSRSEVCSAVPLVPADQGTFNLPVPLAREIRSMREYMGMTHAETSAVLGASVYMVRAWERGEYQIPDIMARKLREMYDRKMGFDPELQGNDGRNQRDQRREAGRATRTPPKSKAGT